MRSNSARVDIYASAGQKATALLKILLAQSGMPLIIDQPEEDLDSQVVQNVVEQIWAAKKGRQLILANRNTNLVVNGDTELVVACAYRKVGDPSGGLIKLEGLTPVQRDGVAQVAQFPEQVGVSWRACLRSSVPSGSNCSWTWGGLRALPWGKNRHPSGGGMGPLDGLSTAAVGRARLAAPGVR